MNSPLIKLALSLSAATVMATALAPAFAVTPNPAPSAPGGPPDAQFFKPSRNEGPPSLFEESSQSARPQAFLDVIINVPHKKNPRDTFVLYPYPVKPPKTVHPAPLPATEKDLKQLLLSSGYHHRDNPDKPYQTGGWRWQYCYRAAVNKSGLGVPHTIFSEYQWAHELSPYVAAETKKWNEFEDQRWLRYQKALSEFERNHADAEAEAVQQGLYPIQLRKRGFGWTQQNIPVGTWWLAVTRKVPGLTYYWQVPMTAAPSEKIKLQLTELNALVIEGGW